MVKQEKAVLRTTGEKVKNCVIIRKSRSGFWWINVFENGNYGDRTGNFSEDVTSCKNKIKSTFKFWRAQLDIARARKAAGSKNVDSGFVLVYFDYEGAKKKQDRIPV